MCKNCKKIVFTIFHSIPVDSIETQIVTDVLFKRGLLLWTFFYQFYYFLSVSYQVL